MKWAGFELVVSDKTNNKNQCGSVAVIWKSWWVAAVETLAALCADHAAIPFLNSLNMWAGLFEPLSEMPPGFLVALLLEFPMLLC